MSILSTALNAIKRVLGFKSDLDIAFSLAALLVQKIEDTSLTGAEKLAWVKEQLELVLGDVAPKLAVKFAKYWPQINAYINALVALAKVAKLFSGK